MHRMAVWLLLMLVAAGRVEPAVAKSASGGMWVPGERWTYESDVGFGSSDAAAEAAEVPHFAYLEPPESARREPILVAPVELTHLVPDDRYLRYRVSFQVPQLAPGRYRVVICDSGCANLLADHWQGLILRVVKNVLERDLRTRMRTQRFELGERVRSLRRALEADVELRDIRQRYLAGRGLDLAQRVERIEGRPLPTSPRSPASVLWLVGLGAGLGVLVSFAAGRR